YFIHHDDDSSWWTHPRENKHEQKLRANAGQRQDGWKLAEDGKSWARFEECPDVSPAGESAKELSLTQSPESDTIEEEETVETWQSLAFTRDWLKGISSNDIVANAMTIFREQTKALNKSKKLPHDDQCIVEPKQGDIEEGPANISNIIEEPRLDIQSDKETRDWLKGISSNDIVVNAMTLLREQTTALNKSKKIPHDDQCIVEPKQGDVEEGPANMSNIIEEPRLDMQSDKETRDWLKGISSNDIVVNAMTLLREQTKTLNKSKKIPHNDQCVVEPKQGDIEGGPANMSETSGKPPLDTQLDKGTSSQNDHKQTDKETPSKKDDKQMDKETPSKKDPRKIWSRLTSDMRMPNKMRITRKESTNISQPDKEKPENSITPPEVDQGATSITGIGIEDVELSPKTH
ncbi:MAG: hypothetical protein Q9164_007296, partial [Protoblastenia rupestris]